MISLKNKVVIITGASSGVGKATAIRFAKKGAKIVIAARRLEKLQELKRYIHAFNENCICIKTDVTKEKEVVDLFNIAEEKFGYVEILVNNAGRGLKSDLCNISYSDWSDVLNVNLNGVFLCTKEAVKRMKENKNNGHIITVSSIAGRFGAPYFSGYCSSKHAVTGFMKSINWELRKFNIKTSTIYPGRINTEFFDIYNKRPSTRQMLSPSYIADYILAIASLSYYRKNYILLRNLAKRLRNFFSLHYECKEEVNW
jgi:NADP-dependent 3-hydroxy acid dehydrogenase YdfG